MSPLEGICLAGYRSFGAEFQHFGLLGRVNLLVGGNNSGKSNVVRLIAEHVPLIRRSRLSTFDWRLPSVEVHQGEQPIVPGIGFGLGRAGERYQALLDNEATNKLGRTGKETLKQFLEHSAFGPEGDVLWFRYRASGPNGRLVPDVDAFARKGVNSMLKHVHAAFTQRGGGGEPLTWLNRLFDTWLPPDAAAEAILIPAVREVGPGKEGKTPERGDGLIDRLAALQHPVLDRQSDKARFEEINRFLQTVLGDDTARLDIPHDASTILVYQAGRVLPLEFLGTGVHEVVILAATATLHENTILCIEEPELHLHPALQRKLLGYLEDHTTNQYFITTHSAHLLDRPSVTICHVRHDGRQSSLGMTANPEDRFEICRDLGYKASDLVQANSVIWVEGPSDRIYLNWWLNDAAPHLHEGVEYSIMFYGGRLLAHLGAKDPAIEDFINLRRLNQNLVILIDSDRHRKGQLLNATKRRVIREFNRGRGFAWVTHGREMEHYLTDSLRQAAIKRVYAKADRVLRRNRYTSVLRYRTANGEVMAATAKVRIARAAAELEPDLSQDDLAPKIKRLVRFIEECAL